jgi:NDP-sugar pyrophosphorylase family protein
MNKIEHSAIIFVGGPGQSDLRKAAGHPVCLLPIPGKRSLLHSWIDSLKMNKGIRTINIVTGRTDDVECLEKQIKKYGPMNEIEISVNADQASHRGTAGALKDFISERSGFENLIFIEGNRIPPEYPEEIFSKDFLCDDVVGVLGRTALHETAGMILMKREMLKLVPDLGFFDFKEQLIPRTLGSGSRILVKEVSRRSIRLSTPESYLKQLIEFSPAKKNDIAGPYISSSAHIDPSALLGKNVIIGANVTINARCLIQDSVILEGSTVGADSTVIRSIISRNSTVDAGTSSVMTPHDLNTSQSELFQRRVS